jgi:hypothetical protein
MDSEWKPINDFLLELTLKKRIRNQSTEDLKEIERLQEAGLQKIREYTLSNPDNKLSDALRRGLQGGGLSAMEPNK